MERAWSRRVVSGALALSLGAVSLAVGGSAQAAAPHSERPPSVQIGWTDSATPGAGHTATGDENLPLGTSIDDQGTTHTRRVYATFDLSKYEGTKGYGGTVYVQEQTAADCSKRAIEIWRTKPVDATPKWNKPPAELTKLDEILTPEHCPTATISFDVSAAIVDAIAHKQRRVTFEIRVPEQFEADPSYARELYWYRSVQLSMQYNTPPKIDSSHLYNGGFACSQLKPPVRLGGFASTLEAVGTDADTDDSSDLTTEFAVWPKDDPEARTVYTKTAGRSGRVNRIQLPAGALIDGKSYGWQARVSDGADVSDWSKKCLFTYDVTRPAGPTVTSSNYPNDVWAPVGVPAEFTFSGNGDKDVAGFQWAWGDLGVNACSYSGDLGQLECQDPLTYDNVVKAVTPGGQATLTVSPDHAGPQTLVVRSIDAAGNTSTETEYKVLVPSSDPQITVEGDKPQWNQEVLLKLTPAPGVDVSEYEVTLDGHDPETREADEDGTAYYRFWAADPNGHRVTVRSHSPNGFVSPLTYWSLYFDPWPGVTSDVYTAPPDGHAEGGVGVEGKFTFTPPPGWTDTKAYRYQFGFDAPPTEVLAGDDGTATITWSPTTSGYQDLIVSAVRPDGTLSDYDNYYSFTVAD